MKITIGKDKFETSETLESTTPVERPTAASGAKRRELVKRRSVCGRAFSLGDGKVAVEYGGKPLFYAAESGALKKIDNAVVEKAETFENKSNSFKAKFYKRPDRGVLFELEERKSKVRLVSKDAAARDCAFEKCACAENNRVKIKNIKSGADLEYVVAEDRIKENIIIKERANKYEFDFEIDIDGLYVDVSENGRRLELRRKETGNVQYYIPAPFMTDARGVFSESAYYEITRITADKLDIKVVADASWINAENREFPVTIDPQIVINRFEGSGVYDYAYTDNLPNEMFRYETLHDGKVVAEALYVSCVDSYFLPQSIYESRLIINRRAVFANLSLPASMDDINKVTLFFTVENKGKMGDIMVADSWIENCSPGKYAVDVTYLFKSGGNEVVIPFANVYNRGSGQEEYIFFTSPTLELEVNNKLVGLEIKQPPVKTKYYTGETFDPAGMIVAAIYADGTEHVVTDYDYSPRESLSSFDKGVTVTYNGKSLTVPRITVIPMTFNDRRADKGKENVYRLYEYDSNGKLLPQSKYVLLELADGAEGDETRAGTPLSAKYLNNIRVKAENIVGVISEKNLPVKQNDICVKAENIIGVINENNLPEYLRKPLETESEPESAVDGSDETQGE